jgi:membrane protease YdiL (CAAX protease family)
MTRVPIRGVIELAAAIAIAGVTVVGVQVIGARLPAPGSATTMALLDAGLNCLLFGVLAVCGWIGGWRVAPRDTLIGPQPGTMLGLGAALGAGGLLSAFAYAWLSGAVVPGAGAAVRPGLMVVGLSAAVVQAGGEELFFRGWVQRRLAADWSPVAGLLVTAIVFAGLHLLGGARASLSLVNLLLGGVWFGLLAQRTGGVMAPAAAHILWNASEQLLLGLDPNPGVGSYGALFDRDLVGRAIWGGSDEGLNASVAVTLVLIALILPLGRWGGVQTTVALARAKGGPDFR